MSTSRGRSLGDDTAVQQHDLIALCGLADVVGGRDHCCSASQRRPRPFADIARARRDPIRRLARRVQADPLRAPAPAPDMCVAVGHPTSTGAGDRRDGRCPCRPMRREPVVCHVRRSGRTGRETANRPMRTTSAAPNAVISCGTDAFDRDRRFVWNATRRRLQHSEFPAERRDSPTMVFNNVDLPEPLEPTRARDFTRQQRQGDVVDNGVAAVTDRPAARTAGDRAHVALWRRRWLSRLSPSSGARVGWQR